MARLVLGIALLVWAFSGCVMEDDGGSAGNDDEIVLPAGAQSASVLSGASFDFSSGMADSSGISGDFRYDNGNIAGLTAAPCGVSWWSGEGIGSFEGWIADPSYLPPAEAYVYDSRTDGSDGEWSRWLKTEEGRFAMIFSVKATSDRFDFFYVYPYGEFVWSDTEKPEAPVIVSVSNTPAAGALLVKWEHSPSVDVAGYWILFGTSPSSWIGMHAGYTTTYTQGGLVSDQSCSVQVRAYDQEGNMSDPSLAMTAIPR